MAYKWINNTQSLVELISNFLLTDDERNAVYPSRYDMGNLLPLDADSARPVRVSAYLLNAFRREPKPLIRSVKDDIKQWTSHEFKAYYDFDPSIATKVLCSIYEFRVFNYPRLTSLLEGPKPSKNYSSEFRSVWPFDANGGAAEKAREIVAVVADLKAMMTFQMGRDHVDLKQVMLLLQCQFESRSFPHVLSTLKGYRPVKGQVMWALRGLLPKGQGTAIGRLDQALFIHLTLLEVEHKLYATDALVEFLKTDISIPSLQPLELGREWLYSENKYTDYQIFELLSDIAGISIERQHWQLYWNFSTLVLAMRFQEAEEISLIERFAALVTVSGATVQGLEYSIWWKGYKSISQRPWYYLKNAVESLPEAGVVGAIDTIPYGYREFWSQRYSLIVHRCLEAEEVWVDCNACASEEVRMVVEMFRTSDISTAIQQANVYIQAKAENSRAQSAKILAG
ncbi:hypothetical protein SAMN04244574_04498 [Azotobacter beijerinckii]|uniref:Uncharacterized protein n=2 Tax=Azotobacter beijerinckii TaxID=170623 RepID=A0A1I4I780_9GAMM|nr:hypothetical protein SAMN04244574_04498 [Azotobacter beijerinckii]